MTSVAPLRDVWDAHPISATRHADILGQDLPAWEVDHEGVLVRANRLALWLWDLLGVLDKHGQPTAAPNIFDVFARNAARLPVEANLPFWQVQFKVMFHAYRQSGSPLDNVRRESAALERLWSEVQVKDNLEGVWFYPLQVISPPEAGKTESFDLLTTVARVATVQRGVCGGFLSQASANQFAGSYLRTCATIESLYKQFQADGHPYVVEFPHNLGTQKDDVSEQVSGDKRIENSEGVSAPQGKQHPMTSRLVAALGGVIDAPEHADLIERFHAAYSHRAQVKWLSEYRASSRGEMWGLAAAMATALTIYDPEDSRYAVGSRHPIRELLRRDAGLRVDLRRAASTVPEVGPALTMFVSVLASSGIEAARLEDVELKRHVASALSMYIEDQDQGTSSSDPW